jgi:hypothetical protein
MEIAMNLLSVKLAPVALGVLALAALPRFATADQPLGKIKVKSITLTIDDDGFAVLRMTGTAEELGNCACYGEIVFVPGAEPGTLDGLGVVAFEAANGDLLVGVIAAQLSDGGTFRAEIHWRDAVTLSDGSTVESTGRFFDHRPPGVRVVTDDTDTAD